MAKQVTITNLVGTEPYTVSLCDSGFTNCIYVDFIYNVDIPYSFLVPTGYENLTEVGVRVIDSIGCIVQETVNV